MDFLQFLNNGYDPRLIIGYGGLGYHPQLHMYGEGLTKLKKFEAGGTHEDPIDYQLDLYSQDVKEDDNEEEEANKLMTTITDESYNEYPDLNIELIEDFLNNPDIDEEDRKNLENIKLAIELNKYKGAYKEAKEKQIAPKIDIDEKVIDDVIDRANKLMVKSNVERQEIIKEQDKRIKKKEPEPEEEFEEEEVVQPTEPEIKPYKNEVFDIAGEEAKQKYPDVPVHMARGNVMEDILDQHQDFFEAINPDVGSEVYNTKREDCPFYTKDMMDYYENNLKIWEDILENSKKNLQKAYERNEKQNVIDSYTKSYLKSKEDYDEKHNKLKFMVVDYLSKNSLFELKTLTESYETLKRRGNVHLITNKIEGKSGDFKPKFIETNDGRFCETLTFERPAGYRQPNTKHEAIVKSKYSYEVIFCLSDGFYIYDVLKDPDIIINENGRAKIKKTRIVDGKEVSTLRNIKMGEKDKEHYLIPIDRIRQMNKSDYERIFSNKLKNKKKKNIII